MAQRLEGVEIMRTGKFRPGGAASGREVSVTDKMLEEMVTNFKALEPIGGFTPVLKLGHTDAQRFIGQADGAPNLGLVEKIWRDGEKVLATFINVPDAVIDLIAQRRFNSVSVEIIPKFKFDGKTFSNVLTAVALLGAQLPAVKGLKELGSVLFTEVETPNFPEDTMEIGSEDRIKSESAIMPETNLTQKQHESLVEAAVVKAVKAAKDKFAETEQRLTAERDEALEALKTEKANFSDFQQSAAKAQAEATVEQAIKDKKLLPKQKDQAVAFMMAQTGTIKFGNEEKSAAVMFAEFLDAMPPKVDTSEKGAGSVDDGESTEDYASDPGKEVHERALKLQTEAGGEEKMTYADARKRVLAADIKLADAYTFAMS